MSTKSWSSVMTHITTRKIFTLTSIECFSTQSKFVIGPRNCCWSFMNIPVEYQNSENTFQSKHSSTARARARLKTEKLKMQNPPQNSLLASVTFSDLMVESDSTTTTWTSTHNLQYDLIVRTVMSSRYHKCFTWYMIEAMKFRVRTPCFI